MEISRRAGRSDGRERSDPKTFVGDAIAPVMRSDLGSAAKLCYFNLWLRCDGNQGTVHTSYLAVAADVGRTESAVRKAMEGLYERGLVELHHQVGRNLVLYVHKPDAIERPVQLRRGDPQRELFGSEELPSIVTGEKVEVSVAKPPRVEVSHAQPPERFGATTLGEILGVSAPSSRETETKTSQETKTGAQIFLEEGARSTVNRGAETAAVLAAFLERSQADAVRRRSVVLARVRRRLGDGRLRDRAGGKIAAAVVAGLISMQDVDRVIDLACDAVAAGKCAAPTIYFVGAMMRLFEERGVVWDKGQPRPNS